MTPQDFKRALTPRLSPLIPKGRRPTPKQMVFMGLSCREAGFGGATGGGKSDALLMDALQNSDVPGYAALLIRRNYSDLSQPGALMDRAHDWLAPTAARWKEREKTWLIPTEGKFPASLTFGYMETDKDRFHYQGSEIQYYGADEATQLSLIQYTYPMSRVRANSFVGEEFRRRGRPLVYKVRTATNPGGVGHVWYKERFITARQFRCSSHPEYAGGDAKPGWGCEDCNSVWQNHQRVFVPSGLVDNPHIDMAEYLEMLANLDPVTREQYINGNWDVTEGGGMFERRWLTDSPDGFVPAWKVRKKVGLQKIVRVWDFAATKPSFANADPDWTAGVLMGLGHDERLYILDARRIRETPGAVKAYVARTLAEDQSTWGADCDHLLWRAELEPGSSGKAFADDYTRTILSDCDARFSRDSGKKHVRARPLAAAMANGHVSLVLAPWNGPFLDELEMFAPDMDGGHDDWVDAASLACRTLRRSQKLSTATFAETATVSRQTREFERARQSAPDPQDPRQHPAYIASLERGRRFGFDAGV